MIPLPQVLPPQHPDSSILNNILGTISRNGMGVITTNIVPTTANVAAGQAVIYDNGSGTKRIYVITHLGNLGYISLT